MPTTHPARISLSPPHLGGAELGHVQEAFATNYIAPVGPKIGAFESACAELTGLPHCCAVASGTAAMHLALRHLFGQRSRGGPPPLVFASTLTFIGSVSPATFEHADLTFIDCAAGSWNMDVELLAEALAAAAAAGRLPDAVIPTDLYGDCCDLSAIQAQCEGYGVPVVCDAAEAVGSRYRHTGVIGGRDGSPGGALVHAGYDSRAAVLSFNGNKIITCSGGGMLCSRDADLVAHARKLATQARDAKPWYEHTEIGFNYRLSNVAAAIGLGQLEVLEAHVARRRQIRMLYEERLAAVPGFRFMPIPPGQHPNHWLTVVLIDEELFGETPEQVRARLESENIESRPVWKPMHLQPVFREDGAYGSGHTVRVIGGRRAEALFEQGLCLPSGSALTDAQIDRIASVAADR